MEDANIEEMDLDSMSMDELDSLLTNEDGAPSANEKQAEPEKETVDEEENIEPSSNAESVEEDSVETVDGVESESSEEESDIEPQYKGKSKEDILEMQRNANRKISQQNNELYHLKKQMEELKASQEKSKEVVKEDLDDDILANYVDEDVKAIDTLVNRAILKREEARLESERSAVKEVTSEHDDMWENLEVFNPDLFGKIKDEALVQMKADKQNTYYKKGWMKQFIADKVRASASETQKPKTVIRKRTTTVTGGGASSSVNKINKSIDDMNLSEFEAYQNAQGIKF